MAAKFEISKDHAGKFRFHLKAPNGEIIAASQGYPTRPSEIGRAAQHQSERDVGPVAVDDDGHQNPLLPGP
jgi:hypothetical protein